MINVDTIIGATALLGNYSDEELEKYMTLINTAIEDVNSMLKAESYWSESRVMYLAATKANYDLAVAMMSTDNVSEFTAGDVSIVQNTAFIEYSKSLVEEALNKCATLINDNGFAFLGV
jgi:hypothetical protein